MSLFLCLGVCPRSLVGQSARLIRLTASTPRPPYASHSTGNNLHSTFCYSTSTEPLNSTPEETLIHRIKRIERRLNFRGYSLIRISAGLLLCTGVGVYLARDYLRENVAEEVSSVASRSLGDETVILKAEELSKALLQAILNDQRVKSEAVRFLGEVIKTPEMQRSVVRLLTDVLNDPTTQRKLLAMLKQLIARSLSDPTFQHNLSINLKDLFDDPVTRAGLISLLQHILRDEAVKDEAKVFVRDVLASNQVREETERLGKSALTGVVEDEMMQKKTGNAIWSSFTYSIRPSRPWWLGGGGSGGGGDKGAEETNDTNMSTDNGTKVI